MGVSITATPPDVIRVATHTDIQFASKLQAAHAGQAPAAGGPGGGYPGQAPPPSGAGSYVSLGRVSLIVSTDQVCSPR